MLPYVGAERHECDSACANHRAALARRSSGAFYFFNRPGGPAKREEPSEKRNSDANEGRDSGHYRGVLCGSGDLALLSLKSLVAALGLPRFLLPGATAIGRISAENESE